MKPVTAMDLDDQQFKQLYDQSVENYEAKIPFSEKVKEVDYRFQWAMKKALDYLETKGQASAIDVGSNYGVLAHLLHEAGFDTHGIDVSEKAVKMAEKNVPGAKFVQGFADRRIPWNKEAFDIVICQEVIEHVKDLPKLIDELWRVCKPGGKILITTPVGHAYDNPEHVRYFDWYKMYELFIDRTDKFKICRIYKIGKVEGVRRLFALEVTK